MTRPSSVWKRFLASAALVSLTLGSAPASAAGAALDDATEKQKSTAKEKYIAGKAAFDEKKYEQALELFTASYETVASPNSHLMMARCLARLGRHLEAYEAFAETQTEAEEAVKQSSKYEATATAARNEGQEVKNHLASLTVSIEGSATIDGRDAGPLQTSKPVLVAPGSHTVAIQTVTGQVEETVEVSDGESRVVSLAPPTPPPPADPGGPPPPPPPAAPSGIDQRTLAYVFGGVGLAGFATFGIFGYLNNQQFNDLEARCDENGVCPADLSDDGEKGRLYQGIANVGLGVGAVGLGTGLILFLTAPGASESVATSTVPRVAVGPGSVRIDGRF